jgi:hypothetical protein
MMNSGFANRIAVESEVMRDYYTRSGLPESKLRVVGTISDDCLARTATNRRQELERLGEELGRALRLPLLVIGGCPNQLASAPGFSFSGYEEMVAHMLECMAPLREHYTLVMRPHPNFLGLARLFEARGVPCSVSDTARLVAMADAYVAFASATIRWAIALGIPSVNYDAFHYDYDDYRSVRGVLHAAEPDEFRAAVARLLPAHPGYSALREACREEASRWGRLDGRSAERIEALIQEVCSERPLRRSSR